MANRAFLYNRAFSPTVPFRDDADFESNANDEQRTQLVEWCIQELDNELNSESEVGSEFPSSALKVLEIYARKGAVGNG